MDTTYVYDNVTDEEVVSEPEGDVEGEGDDDIPKPEPVPKPLPDEDDRDEGQDNEDDDEESEEGTVQSATGQHDQLDADVSGNMITVLVVPKDERITSHIMSKYEYTEAISIRAEQIANHDNCTVDIKGLTSPIDMAERELLMGKSPLVLRRDLGPYKRPDGTVSQYVEDWALSEMQLPPSILANMTVL